MIGELAVLYFAKFKYIAVIAFLVALFGGYTYLKSKISYLESKNGEIQQQLDDCQNNRQNCSNSVEFLEKAIENITDYCHKPLQLKQGELTPEELELWNKKRSK